MTEVSFHFNVPDRTNYTCRLVRKAARAGAQVVLAGPAAALTHFDRALWTFDDLEFLPHQVLRAGESATARARLTRVWLVEDAAAANLHDVLVNLGERPATGFESFDKLIEIVTAEEEDRAAARARWKHYANRGYAIKKFEVARAGIDLA